MVTPGGEQPTAQRIGSVLGLRAEHNAVLESDNEDDPEDEGGLAGGQSAHLTSSR
jgi:hypothetical protein